ncbi:unnamed protein product [Ilex paraguariensis]|uniref:Uncharacterized protein n=1 Tax=Ilex paraguariensis TaxID=185542 RepID=A0ABC8S0E0_9AQUA
MNCARKQVWTRKEKQVDKGKEIASTVEVGKEKESDKVDQRTVDNGSISNQMMVCETAITELHTTTPAPLNIDGIPIGQLRKKHKSPNREQFQVNQKLKLLKYDFKNYNRAQVGDVTARANEARIVLADCQRKLDEKPLDHDLRTQRRSCLGHSLRQ